FSSSLPIRVNIDQQELRLPIPNFRVSQIPDPEKNEVKSRLWKTLKVLCEWRLKNVF
ncbi:unnamed protein product, partial [Larinioides sclopetarius]